MKRKINLLCALLVTVLSLFVLVGCLDSKKEFSGSGITITLDNSFKKKEVIQFPLYIESTKNIFMGNRESKEELLRYVSDLRSYTALVLQNNNRVAEILESEDDDNKYYYAYYYWTNDGIDYGYMLVTMEGKDHYYTMNFACFEKDLEKNKTKFFKWIDTITVE